MLKYGNTPENEAAVPRCGACSQSSEEPRWRDGAERAQAGCGACSRARSSDLWVTSGSTSLGGTSSVIAAGRTSARAELWALNRARACCARSSGMEAGPRLFYPPLNHQFCLSTQICCHRSFCRHSFVRKCGFPARARGSLCQRLPAVLVVPRSFSCSQLSPRDSEPKASAAAVLRHL